MKIGSLFILSKVFPNNIIIILYSEKYKNRKKFIIQMAISVDIRKHLYYYFKYKIGLDS